MYRRIDFSYGYIYIEEEPGTEGGTNRRRGVQRPIAQPAWNLNVRHHN